MRAHPVVIHATVFAAVVLLLWFPTEAARRLAGLPVLPAPAAVGVEPVRPLTTGEFPTSAGVATPRAEAGTPG